VSLPDREEGARAVGSVLVAIVGLLILTVAVALAALLLGLLSG